MAVAAQVSLQRNDEGGISYACSQCEKEADEANIKKAEAPVPVVKRGLASAESLAHVMYQKYANAMPLYRQERDMANQGVYISRSTLANWIIYGSMHWLKPFFEALKAVLLRLPVINADETVLQVLKEEGRNASSESRMWVYALGMDAEMPIVLYEYQPTRSGQHAKRFLSGFTGYLQTDGYAGYNAVVGVIHCGCWSHARRYFEKALPKEEGRAESKVMIGFDYCN